MIRLTTPAIDVREVRVIRGGNVVLPGLSVQVASRTVTALLGPSGSGKTTLMRAIVGVQRIASGTVRVLGQEAGSPVLRSQVGYVTQAPSVYGDLTVRENLRYFARILGVSRDRVSAVIETVELKGFSGRLVSTLSGGQRARVSLATALLNEPPLLILDEPTVGLDPLLRRQLWETFHELVAGGSTLLVSSHVLEEAASCDDLLLLRDGELLATDSPDGLLGRTGAADLDGAFLRLVEEREAA
jgi:ABC-2 type transport system ATP-binding protein